MPTYAAPAGRVLAALRAPTWSVRELAAALEMTRSEVRTAIMRLRGLGFEIPRVKRGRIQMTSVGRPARQP